MFKTEKYLSAIAVRGCYTHLPLDIHFIYRPYSKAVVVELHNDPCRPGLKMFPITILICFGRSPNVYTDAPVVSCELLC